jgi:hypothetical protein
MSHFVLLAQPWWVNLLIFTPFIAYYFFRKQPLALRKSQLLFLACFGIAFGFVEAAAVVYLRTALGLPVNYTPAIFQQVQLLTGLPRTLLTIEFFRELATIIMLSSVSLIAAQKIKQRCAVFLWIFAFWDLMYYAGLLVIAHWPNSLTNTDVLFLIPVPWYAQVWFPILISLLSIAAVAMAI